MYSRYWKGLMVYTWTHGIENTNGIKLDSQYGISTPYLHMYKSAEWCPYAGFFFSSFQLSGFFYDKLADGWFVCCLVCSFLLWKQIILCIGRQTHSTLSPNPGGVVWVLQMDGCTKDNLVSASGRKQCAPFIGWITLFPATEKCRLIQPTSHVSCKDKAVKCRHT